MPCLLQIYIDSRRAFSLSLKTSSFQTHKSGCHIEFIWQMKCRILATVCLFLTEGASPLSFIVQEVNRVECVYMGVNLFDRILRETKAHDCCCYYTPPPPICGLPELLNFNYHFFIYFYLFITFICPPHTHTH